MWAGRKELRTSLRPHEGKEKEIIFFKGGTPRPGKWSVVVVTEGIGKEAAAPRELSAQVLKSQGVDEGSERCFLREKEGDEADPVRQEPP